MTALPDNTDIETKYLRFIEVKTTKKTRTWSVYSARHGDLLATIAWYGQWHQFTFRPEPGTIWNVDCLVEIGAFIEQAMQDWRERRAGADSSTGSSNG